jgi:hypothetical protein
MFGRLERGVATGAIDVPEAGTDPRFAQARRDQRFAPLMERMGL